MLPKIFEEDEYHTVLSWQNSYSSCDKLFMSGIGERYAYRQLSNIKSELSQKGCEICASFEKAVGKAFYYFLFRYYSAFKPECPSCNSLWKNDNEEFSLLISNARNVDW